VVIDTSAALAVLFNEVHGQWVVDRMKEHAPDLRMSTVNVAEAFIKIRSRRSPGLTAKLEGCLLTSGIRFLAPDVAQARTVAIARHRFPLNLGDCFAYALAVAEDCPILSTDRDFRSVDRAVLLPPGM
jgi:ribonuclease VapC